jgi:hypothetical protein
MLNTRFNVLSSVLRERIPRSDTEATDDATPSGVVPDLGSGRTALAVVHPAP